jgi:hypothetical protein
MKPVFVSNSSFFAVLAIGAYLGAVIITWVKFLVMAPPLMKLI